VVAVAGKSTTVQLQNDDDDEPLGVIVGEGGYDDDHKDFGMLPNDSEKFDVPGDWKKYGKVWKQREVHLETLLEDNDEESD